MQNRFGLLDTDVMPIFMIIALDIVITLRFSINCLAVICSPTVFFLSWEKPLVKPMAPGSILYHICFQSTFICIIYNIKYQKYIYLIILSLSDLTFASGREGIDNSFHYKKKTHPWHFGPNEIFCCHTYDTSMTIIVTKPGIIIDVAGSYFYDKKSWQKMGLSS